MEKIKYVILIKNKVICKVC